MRPPSARSPSPRVAARNARVPSNRAGPDAADRSAAGSPRLAPAAGSGLAATARPTLLGALLGTTAGALLLGLLGWGGCGSEPPPGPSAEQPSDSARADAVRETAVPPSAARSTTAVSAARSPEQADAGPPAPWTGPWLGATAQITPIYATTRFANERLGYLRRGGRAPVESTPPVKTSSCREGWYRLVDGGYVCGRYATLNVEDPRVRLGVTPPNLDASLPYRYAYNNAHGTPLYRVVPSREEMLRYEPYLLESKKKGRPDEDEAAESMANADQPSPMSTSMATVGTTASADASASALAAPGARASASAVAGGTTLPEPDGGDEAPPPDLAWWQRVDGGGPVEVKLADLEEGRGTLSRRMVKGFFIAIDRTFGGNNRMWYRTTSGLIAPSDRMVIPKTPELVGIELPEGAKQAGFVLASKAKKYRLEEEGKRPKTVGPLDRFAAVGLTGTTKLVDKQRFHETVEGWWLRGNDATWTDPGKRPSSVGESEKWIDVNLTRKTLVALVGDRPVYAALISPGKRSEDKRRDHRTPTGSFRIREKHVAATMDGDAVVAGDAPYSIEDVPYVQYYDGSYALHGAFWHQNFGREQSHGCVNLAPRDAKWLFFWSEPALPRGWHGVWSGNGKRGSLVVIHE